MGHQASRPIVVEVTNTGVVYVPISRERDDISINVVAGGLTGVEVAWTQDNIIRGPASSYDVTATEANGHVAPASAEWEVLQANAITTPVVGSSLQAFALRLTGTGTGTARVSIMQEV